MTLLPDQFEMMVKSVRYEAVDILSYELEPVMNIVLPTVTAGAHIDLALPNGMNRSYSLINAEENNRYVIAVHLAASGRGGSAYMHNNIRPGARLLVNGPRNHFPPCEDAPLSILVAGGIGITPLWAMIQRLEALGKRWELHYCARDRTRAAFLSPLVALEKAKPGRVFFNFDQEPGGQLLDLAQLLAKAPEDAHLYCCGPTGMLASFEEATRRCAAEQVHVEYFSAKTEAAATSGSYVVELASSGREVPVFPGQTLLEALLDSGIDVPFSCMAGICGRCETRVIKGRPEHRDSILTKAQQEAGNVMMICCSGSLDDRIVLDI